MADERALLQRIVEAPDDEGPRLVLADLLLERNDSRGELIQVQCRLHQQRTGQRREGGYLALRAREAQLLEQHRETMRTAAAPWAEMVEIERGFVEVLHGDAGAVIRSGGEMVPTPARTLDLIDCFAELLPKLFALPVIRQVQALKLWSFNFMHTLPADAPLRLPPNVRRLWLPDAAVKGLQGLARAGSFEHLERLGLPVSVFSGGKHFELLHQLGAPNLKEVVLGGLMEPEPERAFAMGLQRFLEKSELRIEWRNALYDRASAPELSKQTVAGGYDRREPETLSRVPFGSPSFDGARVIDRETPVRTQLWQVKHDGAPCLLAVNGTDDESYPGPFRADARMHLRLPSHPQVLGAESFTRDGQRFLLRYPPGAWQSLFELFSVRREPMPMPVAMRVVAQLARGLEHVRTELHALDDNASNWPSSVSMDQVLLSPAGETRLLPPYRAMSASEEPSFPPNVEHRTIGPQLHADGGTVSGTLMMLGGVLLDLLAGTSVRPSLMPGQWGTAQQRIERLTDLRAMREHPLLPSMLDPSFEPLDELVRRCLTRERSRQWPTPTHFADALEQHPACASVEEVARWVATFEVVRRPAV